jgi:preprotein translocase subunit SecE
MAEEIKKDSVQAAPEKSPEKKEKKAGKKRFFKKVAAWFKEYRSEMKKVVWYPANRVWHDTGVVVAALVVCGLLIGILDLAFTELILLLGKIG